jgi:hypothetical protein
MILATLTTGAIKRFDSAFASLRFAQAVTVPVFPACWGSVIQ